MIRLGMPFDFDSILSSSPPGFELNLDIRSDFLKEDERKRLQFATKARWHASDGIQDEDPNGNSIRASESESLQRKSMSEETLQRISNWESYYTSADQTVVNSADAEIPALPRRVSFADRLESVLVIEELPEDPPWTLCTQETVDEDSHDDIASDEPRLSTNFTQPAADYFTFRNAVETRFVSLANVIVKGYRVSGTVRVKNVAYEKSVVVRHSFDGWVTYHDAVAAYQTDDDQRLDTFAFVIDCPPNNPPGTKLQFAVRYTAAGVDYWDSNRGENYEVLYVSGNSAENYRRFQNSVVFSGQPNYLWSEYSGWSDIDVASPYW